MKGTTEECFSDFGRWARVQDLLLLGRCAHVVPGTVIGWFVPPDEGKERELPTGEQLIGIRVFLSWVGYEVVGFNAASDDGTIKPLGNAAQQLAKLIATGIYSLIELREELGYRSSTQVINIVVHGRGATVQNERAISELVTRYQDDIALREREILGQVNPDQRQPTDLARLQAELAACQELLDEARRAKEGAEQALEQAIRVSRTAPVAPDEVVTISGFEADSAMAAFVQLLGAVVLLANSMDREGLLPAIRIANASLSTQLAMFSEMLSEYLAD